MHRLLLRSVAETDLAEALAWYGERSAVTAGRFLLAVDDAMRRIRASPASFPLVRDPLRRARVPRFPYGIYYRVYPDFISVIGIIHSRRDPAHWQRRA